MPKKKKKVAILMGGPSSEREVSINSGKAVFEALGDTEYEPISIDAVDQWEDALAKVKPDVVFIALHGKFGEDGTVQSILEELNIPYTGSGVRASRLAMDKIASRNIFEKLNIPVPEYITVKKPSLDFNIEKIGFPVVIKPSSQGSSIGMTIIEDISQTKKAVNLAYVFDEYAIIEKFIKGDELTVGILDDEPLPVIKIVPGRKFYDYKAKYLSTDTKYLAPAPIDKIFYKKAQELGILAHRALGCKDFSRVDMILGEDGLIKVLEVNSIPGLTQKSLLPKAANAMGLDFKHLCIKIIELALKNAAKKV